MLYGTELTGEEYKYITASEYLDSTMPAITDSKYDLHRL